MTRMIANRRMSKRPVSLFSFLDILGGTVGVLVLIISVLISQMRSGYQIIELIAKEETLTFQEQTRTASYIICNGSNLIEIHDHGESFQTNLEDPRVDSLINSIQANKKSRYLIIGVRPDGFSDFEALRERAESAGIDIGYEPLHENWRIRAPGGALL